MPKIVNNPSVKSLDSAKKEEKTVKDSPFKIPGKVEPKTEEKEEEPENNAVVLVHDWKSLSHAPVRMLNPLMEIDGRLTSAVAREESKGLKNYLVNTANKLYEYALKLDASFIPVPPKKLQDAYAYASSRSFSATWLALLDKNGNLVKCLLVEKAIWSTMPEIIFKEGIQEVEMKTKKLVLEGSDFGVTDENTEGGKAVPQKVVEAVPFAYNKDTETVVSYKS